jgi:hypothetical protein
MGTSVRVMLTTCARRHGGGTGQSVEAEEGNRVIRTDEPLLFVSEIGFPDVLSTSRAESRDSVAPRFIAAPVIR